jgi:ABC-type branched-subunit amino acid transport system ATPase component
MSITVEKVTKRYQGQTVVNDVSLEVAEGEFFVLLRPSGSGAGRVAPACAAHAGGAHEDPRHAAHRR